MAEIFIIKLLISFLVGGLYVVLSTIAADKLGSKIGGIITTLPSATLFGFLFIAWTQSVNAMVESTTLVPAVVGIACAYLITYVITVKRNLAVALAASLLVWLLLTYILIASHIVNFVTSIIIFIICFIIAYLVIAYIFKITSRKANPIKYSLKILLIRGLISGLTVSLAVFIAKIGGPILGGVFTSFPATITSTLIITHLTHGKDFSISISKSALYGWISLLLYVIATRYLSIPLGILWGTLVSLGICYVSAYVIYSLVVKKLS